MMEEIAPINNLRKCLPYNGTTVKTEQKKEKDRNIQPEAIPTQNHTHPDTIGVYCSCKRVHRRQ